MVLCYNVTFLFVIIHITLLGELLHIEQELTTKLFLWQSEDSTDDLTFSSTRVIAAFAGAQCGLGAIASTEAAVNFCLAFL